LTLRFSSALTSIGITFSPSSTNKSILQLLHYGVFEIFEYVIVVKQYMFAYAYHTIQQVALSNRAIIIFLQTEKFLKNISYRYQLYQKCQSSIYGFSIILKFEIYVFCECSDFEVKKGSGEISPPSRFVHLLGVQNLYLRPPTEVNFLLPAIWEIFRIFLYHIKSSLLYSKVED